MTRSRDRFLASSALLALLAGSSAARADESSGPDPSPSGPRLVLSADVRDAALERRVGTVSPLGPAFAETGLLGIAQWERVCVSPCGVSVDPRFVYRVAGEGVVPTPSFSVPAAGAHVDAKLGSSPWRVGGAVAAGFGALGVLAGGTALAVSPVLASEDVGSQGFRTAVVAGGAATLALGVLALGGGLWAFFSNDSSVRVAPREAVARGPSRVSER